MINLINKPFLATFLKGCLIGFLSLLVTKILSYLITKETIALNFDLVFLMFILGGGILSAAFFTRKSIIF